MLLHTTNNLRRGAADCTLPDWIRQTTRLAKGRVPHYAAISYSLHAWPWMEEVAVGTAPDPWRDMLRGFPGVGGERKD